MGKKGPSWFKFFLHTKNTINRLPDEDVGRGIKAALDYFETGKEPQGLSTCAVVTFSLLQPAIDEALAEYAQRVEDGRRGQQAKKEKAQAPLSPP